MAKIGLVTVLFNSEGVLSAFMQSVALQSHKELCLYLVDNDSSDGSLGLAEELVVKYAISSKVLKNSSNSGAAAGNNIGIREALNDGCDYVLLLNNDITFGKEAVARLALTAESTGEYILAPKILYSGTNTIWMAGGSVTFTGSGHHVGQNRKDGKRYNVAGITGYAPTTFMLIKGDVFERAGLMDEEFFAYSEDVDLMYRARLAGFRVYYSPEVTVYHDVSQLTGGGESLFTIYHSNRNRLYFIRKYYRGPKLALGLLLFFFSRAIKYIRFDNSRRKKLLESLTHLLQ